jgi:hypothetical protein
MVEQMWLKHRLPAQPPTKHQLTIFQPGNIKYIPIDKEFLVTAPLGFALWINCFSFDTTSEPRSIVDEVDGALGATKTGRK